MSPFVTPWIVSRWIFLCNISNEACGDCEMHSLMTLYSLCFAQTETLSSLTKAYTELGCARHGICRL